MLYVSYRTQIGMFRPIRMDHTNCLQVAIKTLQFYMSVSRSSVGHRSELLDNIVCIFVYSMHIRISSSNFCSRIPKMIFLVDLLKFPFYNIYMYI
jgi:hypothetical protein